MNRLKSEIKHFSDLEHIWWGEITPAGQKRYDNKYVVFKKYCKPEKKTRILEIGCGDGEFTKRLVKLPSNITATDITPEVVKRARKLVRGKRLFFQLENAEKLSYKDNSFDVVCGVSILHHMNIVRAIKEAYRVLKSGGQFFFTEPNLLNPVIFFGLNIPYLRAKMEFSPDEVALVRWKMEEMLKDVGFSEVVVANYDFLFPLVPASLISPVEKFGKVLEKMPLVKEFSGSLLIWAKK